MKKVKALGLIALFAAAIVMVGCSESKSYKPEFAYCATANVNDNPECKSSNKEIWK